MKLAPELNHLLCGRPVPGASGAMLKPNSTVLPEYVHVLQRTVLQERPSDVLEIGMAFGASTLAILSALNEIGRGKLLSIDPVQSSDWDSVGVLAVQRAKLEHLHSLIEEKDFLALPQLLKDGKTFQFVYIDGWHTFDYVMLDLFYADKTLDVGGVMAFNDCGWQVHKAIRFLTTHRHYKEMDVGLPARFDDLNLVDRLKARAVKRYSQDRYFRKRESWEPNWDFFSKF